MKYVGLDLGSKTLGIAISDELGMIARAVETFRFPEDAYEHAANHLIHFCEKEKVERVVLGLPKHMNGDQGIRAQISYDFKAMLESKSNLKVILEDERLTTILVDKAMLESNMRRKDRKEKKDEMAAVVILQNYLNKI
ncbi:MAG: Holliday junction resolvase RuvX [Anaeroplasmataceae bacterium]|nr:Holliday junction resolvase RuvX [Anaeroplasmataceae bacterium]MDE7100526.1 Holliday junction resolvase RuvX [Anaeroplasmataceae bacterium]